MAAHEHGCYELLDRMVGLSRDPKWSRTAMLEAVMEHTHLTNTICSDDKVFRETKKKKSSSSLHKTRCTKIVTIDTM